MLLCHHCQRHITLIMNMYRQKKQNSKDNLTNFKKKNIKIDLNENG